MGYVALLLVCCAFAAEQDGLPSRAPDLTGSSNLASGRPEVSVREFNEMAQQGRELA